MKQTPHRYLWFLAALLMGLLFCSGTQAAKKPNKNQKPPKTANADEKYDYAKRMYEQGKYSKAISYMEDAQPFFKGRDKYEDLVHTLAWAYFYDRDYYMAAHTFQNYTRLFPSSPKVEECFYQAAFCLIKDIPYFKLDQTSAYEAIKQLQLFINYYPLSERVIECNRSIDQIRQNLALKDFSIAENYLRREIYNSAAVAFRNVVKDYPESKYREEAMYKEVKSLYFYAIKSVRRKQEDRYRDVRKAFELFERSYLESEFLAEAKKYDQKAAAFLESYK